MVVATAVVVLDAANIGPCCLLLNHVMLILQGFLELKRWEHSS